MAADDVIGKIDFQAPDEGTGTDAILVAAGIEAVAEGNFSSSSNATKLSFKTAASEAAAEKMALSSGGDLTVSAGDIIMGTSGKGISFAATGDASASGATMTSEVLDDYEEGTWTATFSTGSGSATMDTSYDLMQYTKIGRIVHVTGGLQVSSVSSPSGSCTIPTLPFNVANSAGEFAERVAGSISPWNLTGTLTHPLNLHTGANYTYLVVQDNAATTDDFANHLQASSHLRIQLTYVTDA